MSYYSTDLFSYKGLTPWVKGSGMMSIALTPESSLKQILTFERSTEWGFSLKPVEVSRQCIPDIDIDISVDHRFVNGVFNLIEPVAETTMEGAVCMALDAIEQIIRGKFPFPPGTDNI